MDVNDVQISSAQALCTYPLKSQAPETSVDRLDMSSPGGVEEVMEFDCHLVDPVELGIRRGVEHPELGALDVDLHEVDPRPAAVKQGVEA